MRRLFIHLGLAKTGTTSLQNYFAQRRRELVALGFDYPTVGTTSRGIAHHNIPFELLGSDEFDASCGKTTDFLAFLGSAGRAPNIVLSSEVFGSCLAKEGVRGKLFDLLRAAGKSNDEVYTIITFRRFWTQMESSYLERLKHGRPSNPMADEIVSYKRWLDTLFNGILELREIVGQNRCVVLDIESRDTITGILSTIGIEENQLPPRSK